MLLLPEMTTVMDAAACMLAALINKQEWQDSTCKTFVLHMFQQHAPCGNLFKKFGLISLSQEKLELFNVKYLAKDNRINISHIP